MLWERFRAPLIVTALVTVTVLVGWVVHPVPRPAEAAGQDPRPKADASSTADELAVRKGAADYITAMNKGDLDAILAFWAPDAEYIDESGKATRGRDAIAGLFRQVLPDLKGQKVTARQHGLRILRPDVALEDGSLECAAADGCNETSRYAVVWVKTDGKWLITSARDLPAHVMDAPSLAYPRLKALEWLVGDWVDDTAKVDVTMNCQWGPNKAFLLLDYEVRREGHDPLTVKQRIGWDPHNGMVRSWVFDSQGGFGEGHWRKDGVRWVVECSGVLPDGSVGEATNVWQYVDGRTFVWRAIDREVDGQPIGDKDVKFVRKPQK